MKTSKKNSAKKTSKKSTSSRSAVSRFKKGQQVTYGGKKFEVNRAYVYNGLPLAIIKNKSGERHMVSQNKLK